MAVVMAAFWVGKGAVSQSLSSNLLRQQTKSNKSSGFLSFRFEREQNNGLLD